MGLDLKQQLKLTQSLVMTPQLQQAIKLLQLNRLELAEVLRQELAENPMLEESGESAEEEIQEAAAPAEMEKMQEVQGKDQGADELDWSEYLSNYSSGSPTSYVNNSDETPGYENFLTKGTSLHDHLSWQLSLSMFSDREQQVAQLLLGDIDDNGYLRTTTEEFAEKNGVAADLVEHVLGKIQLFDPPGVGARDLRECLMIQARDIVEDGDLIRKIIAEHLGNLEKRNYKAMQKDLGLSQEEIVKAVKIISEMDPKPGRRYSGSDPHYISPDIYIYKIGGEYVIVLNEDGLPKLRVSNYYKNTLNVSSNGEAKDYIQEKLRSAVWLIRSIHQRQRTIYKVTESIIKFQRDFLDYGVAHLKPMILKDIADDIGMHESTVSRVTANKFVHTPQGLFELKYFFNSSIRRFDGDDVASESVKNKIKQIIVHENQSRPHSDQHIVELLKEHNIDIARRTVAKYREMLGILPSSRRKKLF